MEIGLTESAGGTVERIPGVASAVEAAEATPVAEPGLSGKEAQASAVSRIAGPASEMRLTMGVSRDYSIAFS
jgi:hypothetical protein